MSLNHLLFIRVQISLINTEIIIFITLLVNREEREHYYTINFHRIIYDIFMTRYYSLFIIDRY